MAMNRQIDVREAQGECPYDGLRSVGDHESSPRICMSIDPHPRERRSDRRVFILNNPVPGPTEDIRLDLRDGGGEVPAGGLHLPRQHQAEERVVRRPPGTYTRHFSA
jgi:hypothetical protein